MKSLNFVIVLLLLPITLMAQKERIEWGKGNEAYRSENYEGALERFDAALEKDGDLSEARFNRANAMVRKSATMAAEAAKAAEAGDEERSKELAEQFIGINKKAAEDFESIAKLAETDEARNKAHYNQGNAHLFSGDYDKAIEAYKQALRAQPDDEVARHNLAFAMRKKQEQEDQQQDEQDQEKQEQEDQEEQDQQDQQDQQNQDDQRDDQQQEPDEPDQMSPEDAEQLLNAMQQREKELQEELNKRKRKPQVIQIEKDW